MTNPHLPSRAADAAFTGLIVLICLGWLSLIARWLLG